MLYKFSIPDDLLCVRDNIAAFVSGKRWTLRFEMGDPAVGYNFTG